MVPHRARPGWTRLPLVARDSASECFGGRCLLMMNRTGSRLRASRRPRHRFPSVLAQCRCRLPVLTWQGGPVLPLRRVECLRARAACPPAVQHDGRSPTTTVPLAVTPLPVGSVLSILLAVRTISLPTPAATWPIASSAISARAPEFWPIGTLFPQPWRSPV